MMELNEKERDLFCDALDIEDHAARRVFLARSCAGDAMLLKRIEELLALQPAVDLFFADAVVWMNNSADSSYSSQPRQIKP